MQREHLNDEQLMLAEAPDAERAASNTLSGLLSQRTAVLSRAMLPEVVIGEIVAITDDGCTPLVLFAGQSGTAAVRARSVLDLRGCHVGQQAVLSFEGGDANRPIVMGVLRQSGDRPLDMPGQVQVDADGERMVVNAKQELVLQCGKASITLTKAGKVLIQGSYVSSRSTGANRLRGGSIQIN